MEYGFNGCLKIEIVIMIALVFRVIGIVTHESDCKTDHDHDLKESLNIAENFFYLANFGFWFLNGLKGEGEMKGV